MTLNNVREHFEQEAFSYDNLILKLIPYYHEQHQVMLDMIDFPNNASIKVLDLGCGTGVLSHLVLKNFQQANLVAFDFSENMLRACKNNLSAYHDIVFFHFSVTDDITDILSRAYSYSCSSVWTCWCAGQYLTT